MNKKKARFFHQISTESISDSVVVLDIDGTLTCGCSRDISNNVLEVVEELKKQNDVYVFSNSFDKKRSKEISQKINVEYILSSVKKPYWRLGKYIEIQDKKIIIIGDKYLTDEIFARVNRAICIRVQRYVCKNDLLRDRLVCKLDDIVYDVAKLFGLSRHL